MLKILVTGATGNVGSEVVRLLPGNYDVCAAVRNPDKAKQILGNNIHYVFFDFTNPNTWENAFLGVNKLFLVRPPDLANIGKIAPALKAAKLSGVEQIVFLSIQGAERNRIVPHSKIERCINELGIPATFLRAGFFMQNLNTVHREDIKTRGELFMPAGNGRTSFIDVRDIAAVAVRALTEDGHKEKAYTLTGGEALTYYEVADIFTSILGKPIRYANPSLLNFIWQMRVRVPLPFILIMAAIYTTVRLGYSAQMTSDVEQLLGRPPLTMQQYVKDYQQFWL